MNPLDSATTTSSYAPALPSGAWTGQSGSAVGSPESVPYAQPSPTPLPAHTASTSSDRSTEKLLSQHFGQTLKNTGVKAEIQIEQGVGIVVRLVQSDTGKVVMQLPPQGVIDLVAEIQQKQDREMKIDDPETSATSEASSSSAESASTESGGLIDALA